ncbi:aldo/keto reductase [Methylorubrum rhodesianum]|uniref:aldo/keto reductase n=1 Tax=Methylorubrum TaxID=2282523 RepID=UPI001619086A|nr:MULTISPECIES: aldo/keto reductase [Methylorubrum]MBI1692123.1 hypothetical protein [Methylorubrum sp. DB1722]
MPLPGACNSGRPAFSPLGVDPRKRVAAEAGQTPARVALAWVVGRPGVALILLGVSRTEQVIENVAALGLNTFLNRSRPLSRERS